MTKTKEKNGSKVWQRTEDKMQPAKALRDYKNPVWVNVMTGEKIRARCLGGVGGSEWEAILFKNNIVSGMKIAHGYNKKEIMKMVKDWIREQG